MQNNMQFFLCLLFKKYPNRKKLGWTTSRNAGVLRASSLIFLQILSDLLAGLFLN